MSCESRYSYAVLVRNFDFRGRDTSVVAGNVSFGPYSIPFLGGKVIVDRRIDRKGETFTLVHQCGEHKVGKSENRTALTYASRIEMGCRHLHCGNSCPRGNFRELDSGVGRKVVVRVENILKSHVLTFP